MNNKPNNDLTDQMKKELREAKTKEELDALVSSAGIELDDEQLDAATGGFDWRDCPPVQPAPPPQPAPTAGPCSPYN